MAAEEDIDESENVDDEEDLEKLQAEIARMEAEAERMTKQVEAGDKKPEDGDKKEEKSASAAPSAANEKCSIYVGQVDYSSTPQEVAQHFQACGVVERVTIVCDKYTGQPKGFAYVEFQEEASVNNAIKLDGSEFKGRQLKITPKRVNQPGMGARGGRGGRGGRGPGGRGGRGPGRGRGRGGFRGRGFRGRGRHHPYY